MFQDFDAARRERQRALTPITFQLGGQNFECVKLPTLADSFSLATAPEPINFNGTPQLAGVAAIVTFIEALLVNNRHRKRFRKMLESRDEVIDAQSIVELGEWLAEEYSARPTVRSAVSSVGPPPDGQILTSPLSEPAEPSLT